MATLIEIKRRSKSVASTKQLTRAMELVATSRMRRAMQSVLQTRDYAKSAWQIVSSLGKQTSEKEHPLLRKKTNIKKICFLLLTTNRGLCGSLNQQVISKVIPYLKSGKDVSFVTWGSKGREMISRFSKNIIADFKKSDRVDAVIEAREVANFLISIFLKGEADEVWLAYSDFVSMLKQKPALLKILPLKQEESQEIGHFEEMKKQAPAREAKANELYVFEPKTYEVLQAMLPRILQLEVFQAFLESYASEQAARMIAMKNATSNAEELISELNLIYNQARQMAITQELAEITSACEII